jgi:hypothetical protein
MGAYDIEIGGGGIVEFRLEVLLSGARAGASILRHNTFLFNPAGSGLCVLDCPCLDCRNIQPTQGVIWKNCGTCEHDMYC